MLRGALASLPALTVYAGLGRLARAQSAPGFNRPLPIPTRLDGQLRDGIRTFALRAVAGQSQLVEGFTTPTWGYNGPLLGPALRVPAGQPVRITVRNDLAQSTTVHWHGAHVRGRVDGGPQSLIAPGQAAEVAFRLDQPGATLWFHPHPDGRTGPQVYAGLAGLLLVDDGVDRTLGLPTTWGIDDIALIVQDRRLDAQGRLLYMDRPLDVMGMKGDRVLVNGRERPYVAVPAQRVRLRVLNGSNARMYNLAFNDNRPFQVIASDAGLLAAPVEVRQLLLAPGERAEIVVDLARDAGRSVVLQSDSGDVVPGVNGHAVRPDALDFDTISLVQLRVGPPNGATTRVPAALASLNAPRGDAPVRRYTLDAMDMARLGASSAMPGMGGARPSPDTGPGGMSMGTGGRALFTINGRSMDMRRIDQRVTRAVDEVWDIQNKAEMPHPMHWHGTSFRILSRNGAPPPAWEQGWKDVVLVRIGETVRVATRLDQGASDAHPFMFHCHILEHEDNGMMGQFTVS